MVVLSIRLVDSCLVDFLSSLFLMKSWLMLVSFYLYVGLSNYDAS